MRNGRLSAWDRGADGQLCQAISCALSPDRPVGPRAVGVPRASGRRAYQVVVAPIRARFRQFTGAPAPRAVVVITNPEQPEPAKSELLIQLYGLTPKESELTIELSDAKSVEQAADEMGITYQTARTHLRRIFSKTETSRQSELLLLIAKLPGVAKEGKHG